MEILTPLPFNDITEDSGLKETEDVVNNKPRQHARAQKVNDTRNLAMQHLVPQSCSLKTANGTVNKTDCVSTATLFSRAHMYSFMRLLQQQVCTEQPQNAGPCAARNTDTIPASQNLQDTFR